MKYSPTGSFREAATRRRREWTVSSQVVGVLVACAEAGVIVIGSAVGPILYDRITGIHPGEASTQIGVGVLSSVLYVSIARSLELYRLPTLIEPVRRLGRLGAACTCVLLSITAILFMLKIGSDVSRGAFLGFAALMLLLCGFTRLGVAAILRGLMAQGGVLGSPVFLLGDTEELSSLTPAFLLGQFGMREVGRLALGDFAAAEVEAIRQSVSEAITLARLSSAQGFILASGFGRADALSILEDALRASPLPVRLAPNRVVRSIIARDPRRDAGLHLVELQRAPLGFTERAVKRLMDVVGAIIAIAALAPILLLAACAIKLDSPGPIIFRQRRNGFDQHVFVIFKFRTMRVLEDGDQIIQAQPDDRRVTRVGRILRRSSIDELPQLINVLNGDMSLVGPRPHALAHDDRYKAMIRQYCMRHHMKPGISGWAQVNGCRGETTQTEQMQRRVELDLWYIDNWSPALDLRIMARSCLEMIKADAY